MNTQSSNLMQQLRKNIADDEITQKLIKTNFQDYEVLKNSLNILN